MTPERLTEIKRMLEDHPWLDAFGEMGELAAEVERLRTGIKRAKDEFCGDMVYNDFMDLWALIED